MEKHFCCACLITQEQSTFVNLSVIEDMDQSLTYADCIKLCTNVELDQRYNVCEDCISELRVSYAFYRKLTASQRVLKELENKSVLINKATREAVLEETLEETEKQDNAEEEEALELDFNVQEDVTLEENAEIKVLELDRAESTMEEYNATDIDTYDSGKSDITEMNEESPVALDVAEDENFTTSISDDISFQEIEIIPVEFTTLPEENTDSINSIKQSIENTDSEKPRRRFFGKFCCDYCDKLFPNHSRMLLHRRSHEPDRPKFACNKCGRIYATNQALEVHIRAVHQMSGYPCTMCSKVFPVKASLTVHMRFHTGNFPYVCETCGHKFAQLCHLNTHRNVKHKSIRFCCSHPNCKKYFTSSASLRNHEYSHGLMPFECEFCHRGYPSKSKLRVHVRRAHKKDLTLEELEPMRKFHVMRSKPNVMQVVVPTSKTDSSTEG